MRAAEAQRHAEALRRADGDVGADLAGRGEQGEREQVGRDDDERARGVRRLDQRAQVANRAGRAGVLHQHAEDVAVGQRVGEILHDDALSPSGMARVRTTSRVCGSTSASTTNVSPLRAARCASAIASAAAVASSSMDAPATARPVRSSTIVWKLISASSRPWLISGW